LTFLKLKIKSTLRAIDPRGVRLMVFVSNVGVGKVKSMRCAHRNPLSFLNPIHWVQLTFYLQPQKVGKNGRSGAKLIIHFSTHFCRS
jgi:hypothetical protein